MGQLDLLQAWRCSSSFLLGFDGVMKVSSAFLLHLSVWTFVGFWLQINYFNNY